jgi:hypothetical protein
MPVPKAIELLRVDGKHEKSARQTGIDERATGRFDRHRNL